MTLSPVQPSVEEHKTDTMMNMTTETTVKQNNALCNHDFWVPDCMFMVTVIGGAIITVTVFIGVFFNIVSFIALSKMKLHMEMLFLFKCLSIFDCACLITLFLVYQVGLFGYLFGDGSVSTSWYNYVRYYFVMPMFRISGACSFWCVCLSTIQR